MDKFAQKVQKGLITKAEADRRRQQARGINAPTQPLPKTGITPQVTKSRKTNVKPIKAKTQFNMSSIPSMSVNPSTGTVTVKATDIWTSVDFEASGTTVLPKTGEVAVSPAILSSLDAFKSYRYCRFIGLRVTWSPIVNSDTGIFAMCVTNTKLVDKTVFNIANVSNGKAGSIGKEMYVDANFITLNDDWYAFDGVFRYISFWTSSSVAGPCGLLKISYIVEVNNADTVTKPLKFGVGGGALSRRDSLASGTGSNLDELLAYTEDELVQALARARMAKLQMSSSSGAGVGGSGNTDDQTHASTVDSNQGTGLASA